MASPIAEAFVRISPDLSNFRAQLSEELKAKLSGFTPPKIPVALVIGVGEREALRKQIAAITGAVIKVTPVISGKPVAATAATAAAAGVTPAATAAVSTTAADAAVTAETAALSARDKIQRQSAIEFAKSEELRREAAAKATAEVEGFYRAESTALTAAIEKEIAAFNAGDKAAERSALRQQEAAKVRRASLRTDAIDAFERAELRLASVQEAGALKTTEVAAASARVSRAASAVALAKRSETFALDANDKALITNARGLLGLAQAEETAQIRALEAARAQVQLAKAQQASAATSATAARGAGATALSFLGLRGATLAASGAFLAGAAGAALLVKSISGFASFEKTLNTFQAVTGATADQMVRVAAAAKQLGNDLTLPAVSASDAATAMSELAKAGLSVNQSIAATRGVLQLATAASIDNAQATQLVATALNAFHLQGADAVSVADAFANAANAAQGSISDFGQALEQSAAVAHQAGLSLNDTISLLALFARNGLRGSDAGTSLRTALIKLIAPTKQANEVIQALGLHIRDAQGNIRPDIFAQFGEATKNLSPALRDTFAEIIAGTDAIRAFTIGAREGTAGLNAMQESTAKQGTAAEVAGAKTRGLGGDAEAFKNSAATLAITVGQGLAPAVDALAKAATAAVGSLASIASVVGAITRPLAPLGGLLAAVAKAIGITVIPVLALVGGYKALAAIESIVVAAQARMAKSAQVAAVAEGELAAADEAAVAATARLAIAQEAATVSSVGRIASVAGLARGVGRLLGPLGLAATAAIALGLAIDFLSKREDNGRIASEAFAKALDHVGSAANAQNIAALVDATNKVVQGLSGDAREILSVGQTIDIFVKQLRAQGDAFRDTNPLLAHNLNLLADLARITGHLPTKKEIQIIFDNKQTKTSLAAIGEILLGLSGQAQQDGITIGNKINEGIIQGVVHPSGQDLRHALTRATADVATTVAGLSKDAFKVGSLIPNLDGAKKADAIASFKDLINKLAGLGPAGEEALRNLGRRIGAAFAAGISDKDQAAIDAAIQNIKDVTARGNEQIDQAVSQAKSNLGSLSSELAGSVGAVIDEQLKRITDALDKPTGSFEKLRREAGLTGDALTKMFVLPGANAGLLKEGNLDILHRKIAHLADGTIATVKSFSIQTNLGETLLPQVIDGKLVTIQKAIQQFRKTGQNLGTFSSVADANAYAVRLHQQQQTFYTSGQALGKSLTSGFTASVQRAFTLAKEVNAQQKQLDALNQKQTRGQLEFAVLSATDDATRRSAVASLNTFDLQTKLDTNKKKLATEKDNITKIANAQKDAITKNLAAYANQFAQGQITLATFSGRVLATLHKQIPNFGVVGNLLGVAFRKAFDAEIQGVLDQATALSGSQGRVPGGTKQISVTKPQDVIAQVARDIADAKRNRDNVLKGITGADGTNAILKIISRKLGPDPSPHKNTETRGGNAKGKGAAVIGGGIKN